MRNLKFKYLSAKNFFCFGPDGIEINLEDYDNIVLVRGNNLDVNDEEERIASNAVGKTSIPEILVYTLYGKTIKPKLKHSDIINNQSKKNLRTEVIWDNYRVVRTRSPNSLKMWESNSAEWNDDAEITLGGMPETQKLIENKLGLSYEAFVNLVVFRDSNANSFLECDTPTKRLIVENLLSLEIYKNCFEVSKEKRKDLKDEIKLRVDEYDKLISQRDTIKERISQHEIKEKKWKDEKQAELNSLQKTIDVVKEKLATTDAGKALVEYRAIQQKIQTLNDSLPSKQEELDECKEIMSQANDKLEVLQTSKELFDKDLSNVNSQISDTTRKISKLQKNVSELSSLDDSAGTQCSRCYGVIDKNNYQFVIEQENKQINTEKDTLEEFNKTKLEIEGKLNEVNNKIKVLKGGKEKYATKSIAINKEMDDVRSKINQLSSTPRPDASADQKILEQKIALLQKQLNEKQNELNKPSPYEEIIADARIEQVNKQKDCDEKKNELEKSKELLPYYDFYYKAYGDKGIRKMVIDNIMPALNNRISFWLQFLIDNKIKLEFNDEFEETIERVPCDGDPFVYNALSGGERRRINLAISQAFAHIMAMDSGTSPSLVFLDEVTTNIDPIGVVGVQNMMMELAKSKQVFVTTHDQYLLEALGGHETIVLEKKNGFSKLTKN